MQSFLRGIHVVDLRRGRPARRRPPRRHARRVRGPPGPRRGGHRALRRRRARARTRPDVVNARGSAHLLRADLRGADALRRPPARRAGAAQHQRELLRRAADVVAAITAGGGRGRRPPQPLPRPRVRSPCARRSRPTCRRRPAWRVTRRAGVGGQRLQRGAPAPACRPSAGPGAPRWASPRPTRCTRSSPAPWARPGSTGCGARRRAPSTSTPSLAVAQVRSTDPHVVFLCSPNNPTGHGAVHRRRRGGPRGGAGARSSSSTRPTPSSPGPARRSAMTLLGRATRCSSSPAR